MRHDFLISLRREQSRRTDLAGFCLLFFSFTAFVLTSVKTLFNPWYLPVAAAAMTVALVYTLLRARQGKRIVFRYWLFAAAIGWIGMPYGWWLSLLFIGFAFWERKAALPPTIGFSSSAIIVNSILRRRIEWASLQSVILKDGLLTLDFKNNRLLQKEVSNGPDEREFNDFVRRRLDL